MARKRLGALLGRPANGRLENGVLPHRLAVVNFGAALLGAVRAQGWEMHWEGEAALRRGGEVSDGLRPDSRIRLTGPGVALTAWLEVDRGTEAWTWLAGKLEGWPIGRSRRAAPLKRSSCRDGCTNAPTRRG